MRALVLPVLLLVVFPAAAQMYRCVDERGRISYSDKSAPGCKPTAGSTQPAPAKPAPAAPKPGAKGKPPAPPHLAGGADKAKKPVPTAKPASKPKPKPAPTAQAPAQSKAQMASRCKSLREEHDWLAGPRGEGVEARAARLAQVKQAMNACP